MKCLSLLILFFVNCNLIHSQIQSYFIGLDLGINKEFRNRTLNENNLFACRRTCWSREKDFLNRNGSFGINFGAELKSQIYFEMGISRLVLNRSAEYSLTNIIHLISNKSIAHGSGYYTSSSAIKWSFGIGKKISLEGISIIPQFQLSYVYEENNTDSIYIFEEKEENFKYTEFEKNLAENHFFIGVKNKIEFAAIGNWRLHLTLGYNQGFSKSFEIKQQLTLIDPPYSKFEGHLNSRLSHAFAFLDVF